MQTKFNFCHNFLEHLDHVLVRTSPQVFVCLLIEDCFTQNIYSLIDFLNIKRNNSYNMHTCIIIFKHKLMCHNHFKISKKYAQILRVNLETKVSVFFLKMALTIKTDAKNCRLAFLLKCK